MGVKSGQVGPPRKSEIPGEIRVCPLESRREKNGSKCPDLLANETLYQLSYDPIPPMFGQR